MSRPNSAFLGAFLVLVLAVLAVATLAKGGFYIAKHEGDTLHLLQIVLREAEGQWPHLDFHTPIGVLATAPIALFIWLGFGAGTAILCAQIMVAVLALPAIWWVAASRFNGALAYAFGFLVLVLILALVHGESEGSVSISMHYNRWAWAAAFVAIACAMLAPREGFQAPVVDGVVIGAALAIMALTKVTYFGAFILPIAVALSGRHAWRTMAVAAATGLAAALVLTLLAGPAFWLAYLRDLLTVMGSEVRPQPGQPFSSVMGAPAYMGGSLAAIAGVILLRQSGAKREGLVLLLLLPGFFYVTYQNFGNDPQWLWLTGLILLALRPAHEHYAGAGWEVKQSLLVVGTVALAFATPSVINLAYSPFRHLMTESEEYSLVIPGDNAFSDLFAPNIRLKRVDASMALDLEGQPFEAYGDPELRKDIAEFRGETLPDCGIETGLLAYFGLISDDLRDSGLATGKTLIAADLLSSFWLYGDTEPLPGASPWYYGGLPGWEATDYLLVPLCPLSPRVRKILLDEVTEAGTELTEVRRNDLYVLYAKEDAGS
ncbi:MAG: hypothetical protein CSA74_08875 [Rhodobacterales bacterium]|nr:MAG: hypothetical protein CSA74_08875 [Rhodobacterales bacterium]